MDKNETVFKIKKLQLFERIEKGFRNDVMSQAHRFKNSDSIRELFESSFNNPNMYLNQIKTILDSI